MIYDLSVKQMDGTMQSLKDYAGKVLLVVNTASKCGFTPQFEGLEELYKKYQDQGFEILGFPCNQFLKQDPGSDAEILEFCSMNYGVTFPMFSKINVNGKNRDQLYVELIDTQPKGNPKRINWNFTKFLIDRSGTVVERFSPQTKPEKIRSSIESLL